MFKRLFLDESGSPAIEYALLLGLVGLAAVAAMTTMTTSITGLMGRLRMRVMAINP